MFLSSSNHSLTLPENNGVGPPSWFSQVWQSIPTSSPGMGNRLVPGFSVGSVDPSGKCSTDRGSVDPSKENDLPLAPSAFQSSLSSHVATPSMAASTPLSYSSVTSAAFFSLKCQSANVSASGRYS